MEIINNLFIAGFVEYCTSIKYGIIHILHKFSGNYKVNILIFIFKSQVFNFVIKINAEPLVCIGNILIYKV